MIMSDLEIALENSWARETSSDPINWSWDNPSHGQCAVTSLIINDYLGGDIVWANAKLPNGKEDSHYFNNVNGQELDLTRIQFPEETIIPKGIPKKGEFDSTREYILSYTATQERYKILKGKVQTLLQNVILS